MKTDDLNGKAARSLFQSLQSNTKVTLMESTERLKTRANEAVDKGTDVAHETVDKVVHAAHRAADVAGEKGAQIMESQERLVNEWRGFVRDNPMTAIAAAAAVGFVLSRITR